MKILHISHGRLPDPRVEKNAEVLKDRGHTVLFLGGHKTEYKGPFQRTYDEEYYTEILMLLWQHEWRRTIRAIKPDFIHAHDIHAARLTFGLGIPTVYDDHEWWTRNFPIWYEMRGIFRKMFAYPTLLKIPAWERRAIQEYPTLTVSEGIAESHRREYNGWVAVTLNYPSLKEVVGIRAYGRKRNGAVYQGSDARKRKWVKKPSPYRDMTGLPSDVKFDRIYGMPYHDLLMTLCKYKIGLIPWKCHPLHRNACPAKAYDYLHTGLQVISPRSMVLLRGIPYVHFFDTLDEIPGIIETMEDIDPAEIINYAREHLVWESQTSRIINAYDEALRRKDTEIRV